MKAHKAYWRSSWSPTTLKLKIVSSPFRVKHMCRTCEDRGQQERPGEGRPREETSLGGTVDLRADHWPSQSADYGSTGSYHWVLGAQHAVQRAKKSLRQVCAAHTWAQSQNKNCSRITRQTKLQKRGDPRASTLKEGWERTENPG